MSIEYINFDVTKVEQGVLLNGVNCQQQMGSGVALAYLRKWPIVREQFIGTKPILGETDMVTIIEQELYVANCYTQEFFGGDGRRYADLGAVATSVDKACEFASSMGLDVYTPQIGCGLGGLDWDTEVAPIMETLANKHDVNLFVCLI